MNRVNSHRFMVTVMTTVLFVLGSQGFAKSPEVVIDVKQDNIDTVVAELLLDADSYNEKTVVLKDILFMPFGICNNTYQVSEFLFKASAWFEDKETYGILPTKTMQSSMFELWFHPAKADREARKLCLQMVGKYYKSPKLVTLKGRFVVIDDVVLLLVQELEIEGQKYQGELPVGSLHKYD